MLNNIKALVVVLFLATIMFVVARPACLRFMSEEDFRLRRAVWYVITIAAFASPSFWIYALIAVPVAFWAGSKDSNPVAISMIIGSATPAYMVNIPYLFAVNQGTILTVCITIPTLLSAAISRSHASADSSRQKGNWVASALLIMFLTLQVTPYLKTDSWTNLLRSEFVLLFHTLPAFWLLTRTLRSYRSINEVMAVFVLICAVLAPIAVFESLRGWLLYAGVAQHWGASPNVFSYLMRGGQLRALANTDHSLALGLTMALGFGFFLHLRNFVNSKLTVVATGALMWAGMFAAYSRGPWIAAVLLMFVYFWLMPKGTGRVVKATIGAGLLLAMFAATSFGARIINSLPWVGTLEKENVEYRSLLLDRALELIPRNLWFGDLLVLRHMEDLRQGQGIIDIVNGYLLIALFFGVVPLLILLWFLLIVIGKLYATSVKSRRFDMNVSSLGSNLIACIIATLFFIWGARFAGEVFMLSGLALAYAKLVAADKRPAPPGQ